jgi:hypothetical protein
MNKITEKYYPLVTSIITTISIFVIDRDLITAIKFGELINSTLIVFSVLLGFLLTVTTLMHTIDNEKMNTLRQTGNYLDLIGYLNKAVYSALFTSVFSLFKPLFEKFIYFTTIYNFDLKLVIKYLFVFLIILSISYTFRFINLFLKIIS